MPRKTKNLYFRGGTWYGHFKLAGHRYRRSLRTADPREAKIRLDGWRKKIERQSIGDPDSPTFKAAVVKWAAEVLPQSVKPTVAKRYLVSIKQLARTFGEHRVDQIDTGKIAEYVSMRVTEGATNATIRRDLTALSRLVSATVSWGWRSDNPARAYDRSIIRERRDPINPPSPDMVAKLILAAPPAMKPILRLLDQTGLREDEAVTLEAINVDARTAQIRLARTKTNRPRTLDWVTPGGDATAILRETPTNGPLFISAQGQPYRNFASNVVHIARRLAETDPAFVRFRVHDLRHGFAIRWLRNGGNIYALSLHLGHTSVKTTEIYLGHLSAREQAVAQMGPLLAQEGPQPPRKRTPASGARRALSR